MSGFYPEEYWRPYHPEDGNVFARLFHRLENAYREFVAAGHVRFLDFWAGKNPGSGKLLLDIGCGSGMFLHLARRRGYIPHGMDASARAVEIASRQYGCLVRQGEIGNKIWDARRFDYITMFHILEHLPDPRLALRYAGQLLKPSGSLIIQVPNVASIQARAFRNLWFGLDVPRHVVNYTPKALGFLLNEAGFESQQFSWFSLRDNPASIASSVMPGLDPIRRRGRKPNSGVLLTSIAEIAYFAVFSLSLPFAFIESAIGCGGTIWVCARRRNVEYRMSNIEPQK